MTAANGEGLTPGIPSVYERADALVSSDITPEQQWQGIENIERAYGVYEDDPGRLAHTNEDPADVTVALFNFALNPDASQSTLVRAFALEKAVLTFKKAADADADVRRRLPEDIALWCRELEYGFPELFDQDLRDQLRGGYNRFLPSPRPTEQIEAYRHATLKLAKIEGVSWTGTIFPLWDNSIFEGHNENSYEIPLLPMLLMEYHAGNESVAERNSGPLLDHMTPQMLHDCVDASLRPHYSRDDNPDWDARDFSKLTRYAREGGAEHAVPLDFLYKLEPGERREYVASLNRLYDAGEKLADIFPTVSPEAIAKGFRSLGANALFALQHYFEHDKKIDVDVPWFTPGKFVEIREDDPLFVMDTASEAIGLMHKAVTSKDVVPVVEVEDGNFTLFSFVQEASDEPSQVSYLGRPWGGTDFDPQYEFVGDATSRYRVCLSTDKPVALGNAEQTADTVAIRMDFDRFGMAIDVGAIADNPYRPGGDDVEVRIGRFFGFGNYLRSGVLGVEPIWNHIRSLHQAVGADEAKFGAAVEEQIRMFKAKAAASSLGPLLASGQLEQIPA